MELPTAAQLKELVSTLAPGIVILGVRQAFVAAPTPKLEERALSYACVSILYYTAAKAVLEAIGYRFAVASLWRDTCEYLLAPGVIGLTLGLLTRFDALDVLWQKIGVRPVHHVPTAWDYQFSRLNKDCFVLVTLNDGSTVGGIYTSGSFSSSSDSERDLLLSSVYEIHEDEPWAEAVPARSILLCGRDIRSVEFIMETT